MSTSLRILIVDDDAVDRQAVRRALSGARRRLVLEEARNRAAGLEALETRAFDCVIVDYMLPDGTGLDLVREARSLLPAPPPMIVLTGRGDRDVDLAVMNAGAADYLEKEGLRPDILDRTIRYTLKHHRLVRDLEEANGKLKELDRLKSEFLSTASHELRTPLAIIREFVSLVNDGVTGPVNSEQRDCLGSALSNCDRLGKIVDELLDLQRIESGRIDIDRTAVNPATLIRACVRDFTPSLEAKGQRIETTLEPAAPEVLCDAEAITQVLVNLLGNAHKFTPEGGCIRVAVRPGGAWVTVAVEDSGPGIRASDREKIFDKFTQVNRRRGPGSHGTGLGLSICKKIVELHEGDIEIEDGELGGARFVFTLPTHQPERELMARIKDRLLDGDSVWNRDRCVVLLRPENMDPELALSLLGRLEAVIEPRLRRGEDRFIAFREDGMAALMIPGGAEGACALLERIAPDLDAAFHGESGLDVGGCLAYAMIPVPARHGAYFSSDPEELEFHVLREAVPV